jgi:hypothetical protein
VQERFREITGGQAKRPHAIFAAEIMKPGNDLVRGNLSEHLMTTKGKPIESKLNAAGINSLTSSSGLTYS